LVFALALTVLAMLVANTLEAESYVQRECKVSACGALMVADCHAATDGPLLIYIRFPKLLLADCGFWNMKALHCTPLRAAASACLAPSASPAER